jgi:hypothetical protein
MKLTVSVTPHIAHASIMSEQKQIFNLRIKYRAEITKYQGASFQRDKANTMTPIKTPNRAKSTKVNKSADLKSIKIS